MEPMVALDSSLGYFFDGQFILSLQTILGGCEEAVLKEYKTEQART